MMKCKLEDLMKNRPNLQTIVPWGKGKVPHERTLSSTTTCKKTRDRNTRPASKIRQPAKRQPPSLDRFGVTPQMRGGQKKAGPSPHTSTTTPRIIPKRVLEAFRISNPEGYLLRASVLEGSKPAQETNRNQKKTAGERVGIIYLATKHRMQKARSTNIRTSGTDEMR